MEAHQERVVEEKNELDEKLSKLIDFMHSEIYAVLPDVDRGLLMAQQIAMENYSLVLSRRIELF